ncbi:hypothetical protein CRUP_008734 [Coryphaenoides rupestris]|nr:hypothetical protein CRUP_008734 [Coryphaenoides rupestris]
MIWCFLGHVSRRELGQRLTLCSKAVLSPSGGRPRRWRPAPPPSSWQIYLLDVAQITPVQASIVLFVGKAWGAVTDPVVGFFITKSSWTKIGRLMPW